MTTLLCLGEEDAFGGHLLDLLRSEGYRVHVVAEGEAAFRSLLEKKAGLVLADIAWVQQNNFDFLRKAHILYNAAYPLPIIFLAQPKQKMPLIQAMHLYTASSFLLKPLDNDLLLTTIQSNLAYGREQQLAAQSERTRENYLSFYMLIKEIQESLGHISQLAETLCQKNLPAGEGKNPSYYGQQIKGSSNHLIHLIDDVLKVKEQEERRA